ncbi:MAG: hypothetical protein R3C05_08415 [Pirellulaceae bacterium]
MPRCLTRKAAFTIVATQRDYLKRIFDNGDADLVVMEARAPSGWINDQTPSPGLKTLVCSTNEEAWRRANVKRKTLDQRMNKTKNTSRVWFVYSRIASGGQLAERFNPDAEKFALGTIAPSRHPTKPSMRSRTFQTHFPKACAILAEESLLLTEASRQASALWDKPLKRV